MVGQTAKWSGLGGVILGSKSWSRRKLLEDMGVPRLEVSVSNIDESQIRNTDARKLVSALAVAKADALLARGSPAGRASFPDLKFPEGKVLLITGDSVVTHKGKILEKPATKDEARLFLQSYATAPATTVSSILVIDLDSGARYDGVAEAEVYFREIPNDVVTELVERGGSMESAGGLRIEHPLVRPYIDCIVGEESAVMGFSQSLAEKLLGQALHSS